MYVPTNNIGDLVLYKNNQLIALHKPATMPVQADKSEDKSLLNVAEIYCKHPVHLVHRLDRPASGVVLFAKNKKSLAALNLQFQHRKVQKTYLAVVKNKPVQSKDTLVHFLKKNVHRNRSQISTEEIKNSKKAILHYEYLASIEHYHLLQIQLETGRFHQIRAQLAAMDAPIKGDVKYGFRRANNDRSIHLHAWKLQFEHPVSGEQETVVAPLPNETVWQAFAEQGVV